VDTPEIDIDQLAGAVLIPMGQLHSTGFDAYSVAGGTSGWARSGRHVGGGYAPRA
jgi:hypothetical protein